MRDARRLLSEPRRDCRLLTYIVLAGLMIALAVTPVRSTASTESAETSSYDLFVSNGFDPAGQHLIQLDPDTLLDDPAGASIALGSLPSYSINGPGHPHTKWTASADGSVLVGLEYRNDDERGAPTSETVTLVVRDGQTGEERTRSLITEPALYQMPVWVSADGSTVVIEADPQVLAKERFHRRNNWAARARRAKDVTAAPDPYGGDPPPMQRWYVYDTARGALRTTVDGAERQTLGQWIDPTGARLYYLADPSSPPAAAEPATRQIVAHDLHTGAEVGRVPLPEIMSDDGQDGTSARRLLRPGGAISPDGATFAVVSTDQSHVTLIDTRQMAIKQKIAVRTTPGTLERVGHWLGLLPTEAAAKGQEGTWVSAVYAPDGRHLYVFGSTIEMPDHLTYERHGLGLRVIDLTNGEIVASAFPDVWFTEVLPAPDGRTLFTVQSTTDEFVQRVDAKTLEVEAERLFAGYRWFMLRPASDNA